MCKWKTPIKHPSQRARVSFESNKNRVAPAGIHHVVWLTSFHRQAPSTRRHRHRHCHRTKNIKLKRTKNKTIYNKRALTFDLMPFIRITHNQLNAFTDTQKIMQQLSICHIYICIDAFNFLHFFHCPPPASVHACSRLLLISSSINLVHWTRTRTRRGQRRSKMTQHYNECNECMCRRSLSLWYSHRRRRRKPK